MKNIMDDVITCRYCEHYISYFDAYDQDEYEPSDFGFCGLYSFNERAVNWETPMCSEFESK